MGLGGLLTMWGERKTKKTLPYQPVGQNIRDYEAWQNADIRSLYRTTPRPGMEWAGAGYEGPGLGYSPAEMEGQYGAGRDVLAGEAGGETQRTADRFRSPGGMGLQSAMYARSQQRSDLARVARANELRRDMIVRNAEQKRADKLARIAAVTGAYESGVGIYNVRKAAETNRIRRIYAGAGEGLNAIASGVTGGMM